MTGPATDPTPATSQPINAAEALHDLGRHTEALASRHERLARALAAAPTDRLLAGLLKLMARHDLLNDHGGAIVLGAGGLQPRSSQHVDDLLSLGLELTRRGVAPIFRGLPWYCSHQNEPHPWWFDPDSDLLALLLDMQWIANRYPAHETAWPRAQAVFNPKTRQSECQFLHWQGRREPGQIVAALGLSEAMQSELCFARSLRVGRGATRTWRRWPDAQAAIERAVREADRRPKPEQDATIKRRQGLWLAAEFGGWAPSRTAELFAMQPKGERLPRNVVAKQLERLPRLPHSAPECISPD